MLLSLPSEIIIHIIRQLHPDDYPSCQLTCKSLYNLILNSSELQYYAALVPALAEDNPCSNLPVAEKLEVLHRSEHAWWTLRPGFTKTVPVTHIQSGVYDLTAGFYFLSNSTRNSIHHIKLPTKETDEVKWETSDAETMIIDIGLCLHEHDLMVFVTSTQVEQHAALQPYYRIELRLIQFSTGKPHPDARDSTIHVMNSQWAKPAIGIEIVGENLVLILSFNNPQRPDDRVHIYEWKTNTLKTSWLAPTHSYSGFLFLTEDLILIPNTHTGTLDVFRIPHKPTFESPSPLLILKLPALAEGRFLGGVSTRAEPNPIGTNSRLGGRGSGPTRPFLASAEDAICIFDLRVIVPQMVLLPGGGINMNLLLRHRFSFVVHRRALVALVERYGRKDPEQEKAEPEVEVGDEAAAGTGHVREDHAQQENEQAEQMEEEEVAQSLSEDEPSPPPHDRSASSSPPPLRSVSPSEDSFDEDDGSSSSSSSSNTPTLSYSAWGPPIARWFNSDEVLTNWITTTAGQRCVQMEDSDEPVPVVVLDFNPAKVKEGLKLEERKERRREEEWRRREEERKAREEERKRHEEEHRRRVEEARQEARRIRLERLRKGEAKRQEDENEGETSELDKLFAIADKAREELGSNFPLANGETEDLDLGKDFLDRAMEDDDAAFDYIDTGNRVEHGRYQYDPVNPDAKPGPSSKFFANYGSEAGPSTAGPPLVANWPDDDEVENAEDEDRDFAMEYEAQWAREGLDRDLDEYGGMQVDDEEDEPDIFMDTHPVSDDDEHDNAHMDHHSADASQGSTSPQLSPSSHLPLPAQPYNVAHLPETFTEPDEDRIWTVTSMDLLQPAQTFSEPVLGGLPYVACATAERYNFSGVLLDEERVLGLKTNMSDQIDTVEILHFG